MCVYNAIISSLVQKPSKHRGIYFEKANIEYKNKHA